MPQQTQHCCAAEQHSCTQEQHDDNRLMAGPGSQTSLPGRRRWEHQTGEIGNLLAFVSTEKGCLIDPLEAKVVCCRVPQHHFLGKWRGEVCTTVRTRPLANVWGRGQSSHQCPCAHSVAAGLPGCVLHLTWMLSLVQLRRCPHLTWRGPSWAGCVASVDYYTHTTAAFFLLFLRGR